MLGLNGMVNISELLINIITLEQTKDADRSVYSRISPISPGNTRTHRLLVNRQNLTHSVI